MPTRSGQGQFRAFFPVDLILVGCLGLWAVFVASGQFGESTGRTVLGLFAVLFAPGYAAVAALFPAKRSRTAAAADGHGTDTPFATVGHLTVVERLVISVGLSVCLVPLVGIGLEYAPVSIDASTLLGVLGATTMILTVIAVVQRARTPADERFDPDVLRGIRRATDSLDSSSTTSKLTILLLIGFVVAGSGLSLALLQIDRGEQFTEFYLTTEDPDTGTDVAGGFPEVIEQGDTEEIHVGITNNEGETTNYTVIVLLQSLDAGGNVQTEQQLDELTVTLEYGETWHEPHTIRPDLTGEDLRVTYLLYLDDQPERETSEPETAYRHVHFWVDVPPAPSG